MTQLPDSVREIADVLAARGATGELRFFPAATRTAADAAAALGCPVGAIANSLVFMAGDEAVLILTSGAHRVDTAVAGAVLGVEKLGRATADQVRAATGQVIGGVAPLGHPTVLRTLVDTDLADYPQVWAAAGHPHAVFATTFEELVRITGGTPAVVASA